MLARSALRSVTRSNRLFSTSAARQQKVTVLGAGGGIGQPLSLLLKTNPLVSSLSLYDIRGAPGVAADVSHVDTHSEVRTARLSQHGQYHSLLCRSTVTLQTSSMRLSRAPTSSSSPLAFPARYALPRISYHSPRTDRSRPCPAWCKSHSGSLSRPPVPVLTPRHR